jgi:hypothetical protein
MLDFEVGCPGWGKYCGVAGCVRRLLYLLNSPMINQYTAGAGKTVLLYVILELIN